MRFKNPTYARAWDREWLLSNGLGGYSASTIVGANTRKYHGLLVAASKPPHGRRLLVAKLEEKLTTQQGQYLLSTNKYPEGKIYPTGYEFLKEFRLNPLPTFYFEAGGCKIKKKIYMINGANAAVVRYYLKSQGKARLELAPLINDRPIHSLTAGGQADLPQFSQKAYADGTFVQGPVCGICIKSDQCSYRADEKWNYNMIYDWETEGGEADREHHFMPGRFEFEFQGSAKFNLLLSDSEYKFVDYHRRYKQENERIANVVDEFYLNNRLKRDRFADHLALAADQFIVRNEGNEVMAGYPWFGVWGRDAMIALPGIALATGRFDEAKAIPLNAAKSMKDGMVVCFVDEKGEPSYTSADASLWYGLAVYRFLQATNDEMFVRAELFGPLKKAIDGYLFGSLVDVKVDEDGLLKCGPGLTWMDTKVTPRAGKPVELNALWYNVLKIAQLFALKFGEEKYGDEMKRKAEKVKKSFQRFWNETEECLYDVLDPDDSTVRPNQIFAVSFPSPLLDAEKEKMVVEKVRKELLTPLGLRSISPLDARYRKKYAGASEEREKSYQCGMVWPWLMGAFVDAHVNTGGRNASLLLSGFRKHLRKGGVGTISEIIEPESLRPVGCIAQAWSVGEILRAYVKTNEERV
ncbi:glycogen debranching protein [Candidatus Micrarchaeota archaeon]|nr:MAG: glycogen debranching protein [Candidatus Micrarchaeota archaeon]